MWMLREIPVCIVPHIVVTRRQQCYYCRMVLTLVSGIQEVNMLVFSLFPPCGNVCLRKQNLSETGKNLSVTRVLKSAYIIVQFLMYAVDRSAVGY